MIRFECDYAEGAHPKILDALVKSNLEQTPGYGMDVYCESARELIREACDDKTIDVHFLVGGTQTNLTVISSILRSHQGVIAAESGHINTHETGAIEATGHRILTLPTSNGKITAAQVRNLCENHQNDPNHEHTTKPGMVFISHPSEFGTLYSKQELEELSSVCISYNLPLYLDGARLGYGIMSTNSDLSLADITRLCDVFYIGGTKVGALFGEAVIIRNPKLKQDFRYHIKQRGGMLAKGRILGIQFKTLFTNDLYFEISKYANKQAMRLKEGFEKRGYHFLFQSDTNQQFPILKADEIDELSKKYAFTIWEKVNDTAFAVRFCTSWATKEKDIDNLLSDIPSR